MNVAEELKAVVAASEYQSIVDGLAAWGARYGIVFDVSGGDAMRELSSLVARAQSAERMAKRNGK